MSTHNFRRLKIWIRGIAFVTDVYKITSQLPLEEKYGLVSQLRRCAVSIPSNISEGAGRGTNAQFKIFLEYAMGSLNEAMTQLNLCRDLGMLDKTECEKLINEASQIYRMVLRFHKSLRNN